MKKIIGWFLLVLGITIIGWVILISYQFFTAQKPAPEVFKMQQKESSTPQSTQKETTTLSPEKMQEKMLQEMQKTISERLKEMVPFNFVVKLFNLISWSIFAGILIFAGGKISEIGTKLL